MVAYLSQGLGLADVALLVNRIALGFFFAVSGYHKLFVSARHMALDKADWLDDVLYLPEVLYCFMALVIVLAGPGPLALT